jgi:hypothetical protein
MSDIPNLLSWFSPRPIPAIVPDPAIIVDGTRALEHFFDAMLASGTGGHLSIAVPFAGTELATVLPVLAQLRHARVELTVVTSSEAEARRILSEIETYPWKRIAISFRRRLHAKVYSFLGEGGEAVCMIGSHNFSWAGARTNQEAGVLFIARNDPQIRGVAASCEQHIQDLARGARIQCLDTISPAAAAA